MSGLFEEDETPKLELEREFLRRRAFQQLLNSVKIADILPQRKLLTIHSSATVEEALKVLYQNAMTNR